MLDPLNAVNIVSGSAISVVIKKKKTVYFIIFGATQPEICKSDKTKIKSELIK